MTPFVTQVLAALRDAGVDAHVVGGAVRDLLSGREPSDVDVTVNVPALPFAEQLASRLGARSVVMDRERGHARLMPRQARGDIWVDISSDRGDLLTDLARRDFTVNAMAVPVDRWPDAAAEAVADPHHGLADLRAGLLRMVSPSSMTDDPVRLIRAPRLASQFGLAMEEATRDVIRRNATRLKDTAPERVRDELFAMFATPAAERGVEMMDDSGLLDVVLPEVVAGRGVKQPANHHYWDVFTHNVKAVGMVDLVLRAAESAHPFALQQIRATAAGSVQTENMRQDTDTGHGQGAAGAVGQSNEPGTGHALHPVPWRPELDGYFDQVISDGQTRRTLLRLTALLHDVAKSRCKTVDNSGRMRFLGHHKLGEEMVSSILARLRCSRRTISHVSVMVRSHLRPGQMSGKSKSPTGRAVFRYFRDVGPVALDTLYLNMADYLAARGPALDVLEWRRYSEMIGAILARGFDSPRQSRPFLLLDGNAVMDELGLDPGPKVGHLLSALREAESAGLVQTRDEALEYLRRLV
ncbi:MAG: HD domain-containing protein [Dehalococcoidia bacterium]